MKNKLLFLSFLLISSLAFAQGGGHLKGKQLERAAADGQVFMAGSDLIGHFITPPFPKWADTATKLATDYELWLVDGKHIASAAFSSGTLTLTRTNGLTVTAGFGSYFITSSQKAAPNGVATLDVNGKVPLAQLPAQSVSDVFTVASESAMLALSTATQGDFAVRTDVGKTFVLNAADPSVLSNWVELPTGAGITSVNGISGASITLTTNNISEGSTNKYYSDALARAAFSGASGRTSVNNTTGVIDLVTTGVSAGTYNNIQVDVYGRAVAASNVAYLTSADLSPFETKANLAGNGLSAVHWNNITNKPSNIGSVKEKQRITGSTSASFTLTYTPVGPVEVFLNGQLLDTVDYSISGTAGLLGFTPESSDVLTLIYPH